MACKTRMTLNRSEFKRYWQQIPDQNIWRNKETGIMVSVHGMYDQGYFVAKKTTPMPKDGGLGSLETEVISRYYISNRPPIGEIATISRERVKRTEDWTPGTFDDALKAAYRYMYSYTPKGSVPAIKKKRSWEYLL